jgi:DMSO/TMAO reductase YedYZ molybdopterin-dependent catalytic subunit
MDDSIVLVVDGAVERPLRLTFFDLAALPPDAQISDVSRFHPNRQGDGVTLQCLLDLASARPDANYLTLHADRDDFHVSVPLEPLRDQGIVVYRLGPAQLGIEHGGPIRFLTSAPT